MAAFRHRAGERAKGRTEEGARRGASPRARTHKSSSASRRHRTGKVASNPGEQAPVGEQHTTSHAGGDGRLSPQGGREGEGANRSEEHTSELQSLRHLVCRLLLEKK